MSWNTNHCGMFVVVTALKKITAMVSPPDQDFSELSPRNSIPPHEGESWTASCLLTVIK